MSESALNFGGGTSVRLILFFNLSHRHTRTASSYCKLHFPRETATSPKAKQNVITQEFEKYQKVWVLLQKSSVSTNKCGAQTCFIIEMADGPITAVRRDCGKQSVHSDHDPSFYAASTRRQSLELEPTKFKQNSLLLLQWETHRQTNSQFQVGDVYPLHHHCCVSFMQFLSGNKPLHTGPNVVRYWEIIG